MPNGITEVGGAGLTTDELNAWDYTTDDYLNGEIPGAVVARILAARSAASDRKGGTRRESVPVESLRPGMEIDDERFRYVMRVGHVVVGPKWVTARAWHPDARVCPNTPYRLRRGDTVRVLIPADLRG